ncbi:acyl carrier protein [Actinomadura fibrosa]|uniref:Acyl carrier protein n=1 Tax=Actinomadura fibrosa TaxID=111802 RepID=A0ABW2XWH4_9ACTN|nr:phosphopantetheine-binding protein [Actinomadura fibrosa]
MPEASPAAGADLVAPVVHEMVRILAPNPAEVVVPDHRLIHDLGFHSLTLTELAFALEDLFGLDSVTPEQAMLLASVGDVVELIEDAVARSEAHPASPAEVAEYCARYGVERDPRG